MTAVTRPRRLGMWVTVGVLAVAVVVLGSLFVGGLALADEAGEPLGVPAVAVTPGPSSTPGTPSPTPAPSDDSTDEPTIVDELPPVTVELDDHGGDNGNSGSDGGSGGSGSGSGGSGGSDD